MHRDIAPGVGATARLKKVVKTARWKPSAAMGCGVLIKVAAR
jgi:hypothetical protein